MSRAHGVFRHQDSVSVRSRSLVVGATGRTTSAPARISDPGFGRWYECRHCRLPRSGYDKSSGIDSACFDSSPLYCCSSAHLNQVEFWGLPPKSHDEGPELLTGGFRATSSSAHIHKQQQQLTVLLLFSSLFEDFKTPALPSLSFQMGCEQSLILEMLRRQFSFDFSF